MSTPPARFSGRPDGHALGWTTESGRGEGQQHIIPEPISVAAEQVWSGSDRAGTVPSPAAVPPTLVERPHPLTPLVRAWVLVVATVWAIGREVVGREFPAVRLPPLNWLTVGIVVVVLGLLLVAFLDWRATSFIVDPTELRIESGVFVKTSERIRFERIQAVDVGQPFLPRLLGMAEITIDVGAEGGHRLRYLSRQRAAAIRDYLLARAHGIAPAVQHRVETRVLADLSEHDEVLVRVPPQRLLLGALLSHEVLLGVIPFLAVMTWLGSQDPDGVRGLFTGWALFAVVLPALAAFGGFVVRRVTGQWNYAFVRSGHGLKITRGLTNLNSQSVPRHRIQSLLIAQPLWWRRLGLFRVEMAVLGNAGLDLDGERATSSDILLPIGTRAEVDLVLATIWPGLHLDAIELNPSPARARWLQPLSHRWVGWGHDDDVLVTQAGWLTRQRSVVPHARLQSLAIVQGPVRRRLGLASIEFHTTNMLARTRSSNLEEAIARELFTTQISRARSSRFSDLVGRPGAGTGRAGRTNGDGSFSFTLRGSSE